MAAFLDHLYNGTYPYLTPAEFIAKCPSAAGASEDDDDVVDAIADASLIMYYLTGRQFNGTTQTTITPDTYCTACGPYRIALGLWPVTDIISVRENGVDQDPTDYHIDEYRWLVKDNGEAFPRRGNWYAASGDADDAEDSAGGYVFEVTVEHGIPAPSLLRRAVRDLACGLYDDAVSSGDACALPDKVTNITRNGLTMEVADFNDLLQRGAVGIYSVDLAVAVLNPTKMQSPTFVWTPDMYHGTRRYT